MKKIFLAILFIAAISIILTGCDETDKTKEIKNNVEDKGDVQKDAKGELKSLFGLTTNYYVKYNMKVEISGEESRTYKFSTYYLDKNIRQDMPQDEGEYRFYYLDGVVYSCITTKEQPWVCYKIPQMNMSDMDKQRENVDSFTDVKYIGTKTYAGKTGKCYKYTYQQYPSEVCLTDDGIPIYWKATMPEGYTEATATEAGKTSSSDFTLPAQPQEIPDYAKMLEKYQ